MRRQNSHPSDPGLAGSGGSGCVSVESEGEQADSEEDTEGAAVRFQVDEDPANDEKQRLHRRDTPHHLKNKRINQQVFVSVPQCRQSFYLIRWQNASTGI